MKLNRKLLTATVTVIAAVTTAHLMQNGDADTARVSPAAGSVQTASLMSVTAASRSVKPVAQPAAAPVEIATSPVEPLSADVPDPAQDEIVTLPDSDPEPVMTQEFDASPELSSITPVASTRADALPNLPQPPLDARNPAPLPQIGFRLQDRMAALDNAEAPVAPLADAPRRNEFGLTCVDVLSAAIRPAAMVTLTLTSPCRGDEVIEIQHGNLTFSGRLSSLGMFSVQVPALEPEAEFSVTFPDGKGVSTIIEVPEATRVERVVLQSGVNSGLQVHALEFGADYGEAGHIWSATPSDPDTAALTNGGFLLSLGDTSVADGQIAEVYTFPPVANTRDGVVRVSIEAEVTALNCSSETSGRMMQKPRNGAATVVSLTLAIPDCDAIGEYLVLKNLLRDLKVASN